MNNTAPLEPHHKLSAACVFLGLHRNTVHKLLLAGEFPNAYKEGSQWQFPESDIKAHQAKLKARRLQFQANARARRDARRSKEVA